MKRENIPYALRKLAAMNTEAYFAERRQKADFKGFDRIMARKGGVLPEGDDRL